MRFRMWVLLIGCLVLPLAMNGMFGAVQRSRREAESRRREKLFAELKGYFKLPPEAKFVDGFVETHWPMGGHKRVTFSLPNTHRPATWVSRLYRQNYSGGQPTFSSPLKLEGPGDYWRIEYIVTRNVYELEYRWD